MANDCGQCSDSRGHNRQHLDARLVQQEAEERAEREERGTDCKGVGYAKVLASNSSVSQLHADVALSILGVVVLSIAPDPNANIQILRVALSVGFGVLAIVMLIVEPWFQLIGDCWKALADSTERTTRLIDLMNVIAQRLPKRNSNAAVDPDAAIGGSDVL